MSSNMHFTELGAEDLLSGTKILSTHLGFSDAGAGEFFELIFPQCKKPINVTQRYLYLQIDGSSRHCIELGIVISEEVLSRQIEEVAARDVREKFNEIIILLKSWREWVNGLVGRDMARITKMYYEKWLATHRLEKIDYHVYSVNISDLRQMPLVARIDDLNQIPSSLKLLA